MGFQYFEALDPSPLQRALSVAPDQPTAAQARPEQEFFCFVLGNLRLGVPSENVREVTRVAPLTPLPRMPAFMLGVSGHRGEVLPVIDLYRFLGKGETRMLPRTRLFVGIAGNFIAAFLADAVIGLRRIPTADILPPPVGGDSAAEHLLGVVNPSSGENLSLLQFAKLMNVARQRVLAR